MERHAYGTQRLKVHAVAKFVWKPTNALHGAAYRGADEKGQWFHRRISNDSETTQFADEEKEWRAGALAEDTGPGLLSWEVPGF